MLALLLPICLVLSPYHDRLVMGRMLVKVGLYDTWNLDQTKRSLRQPRNRLFEDMVKIIRDPSVSGRVYASAQGSASGVELFYFTILPSVAKRTNVICGFFSAEVAGANKTLIEKFRPRIPKYKNLIELLNVRYLLCAIENHKLLEPANQYADLIKRNASWSLWRTRGDYGHFDIIKTRPVAVAADTTNWRAFCNAWLEAYKDTPTPDTFPFFVRTTGLDESAVEVQPEAYAGLLVLEKEITPEIQRQLDAFTKAALPVSTIHGGETGTLTAPTIDEIDFSSFTSPIATSGTFEENIEERERHGGTLHLEHPGYVLFKTAYYRGWQVFADGNRLHSVEMSPGFLAVRLPAGTHQLEYIYDGPNHHRGAKRISLIALILAIAAGLVLRFRPHWIRRPAILNLEIQNFGMMKPRIIIAAYCIVGITLAFLYVQEQVRKIPIPIRPAQGSHMPTDILADWNYLSDTNARYEVQISEDRKFQQIVYTRTGITHNYARKQNGLEPNRKYWWRLRSLNSGDPSPWSKHVSFRTRPAEGADATGSAPWRIEAAQHGMDQDRITYSCSTSLPEGTYVHIRLYRTDTRARVQSTAARVRKSRIQGALSPPATGWPMQNFAIHYDVLLDDQSYPVTSLLGENGERIAQRDLAPGHRILYGLVAETDSLQALSPGPALPTPSKYTRWTVSLAAKPEADGRLTVMGATSLPNYTRIKLKAYPEGYSDPVAATEATVQNGKFSVRMDAPPGRQYRIRAMVSPDRQYQAPSRLFGFNGEAFREGGMEGATLTYGLRYAVKLTHGDLFTDP
jgi:hypothetical protein